MTEDSFYATRRLDPDAEDSVPVEEEVSGGQTLITPPPLPETEAVVPPPLPEFEAVAPPPLPHVDIEVPPPLPEPEGVAMIPPAIPEVVAEPIVITFPGRTEPEELSRPEVPSPFEEVETAVAPEVNIPALQSVVVTPVAASGGGVVQNVQSTGGPVKKDNTAKIILIVVAVLLLLCCCAVVIGAIVLMLVPQNTWDTMGLVLRGVLSLR